MHKPLSHAEVEALNSALPVMSRADKLERWASLLEKVPTVQVTFGLETLNPATRATREWDGSPMSIAAADPVLKDAGLAGATIGDTQKFFELSDAQIHAFNCGCHQVLSGPDMANYLRQIAQHPF